MDYLQTITFAGIIGILTLGVGILVKIMGLPDQMKKNFSRKSTKGLSTTFMILSFIAYTLWTIHGILRNDMILVFGQGLGIITTGIIIWQIYIYIDTMNSVITRHPERSRMGASCLPAGR